MRGPHESGSGRPKGSKDKAPRKPGSGRPKGSKDKAPRRNTFFLVFSSILGSEDKVPRRERHATAKRRRLRRLPNPMLSTRTVMPSAGAISHAISHAINRRHQPKPLSVLPDSSWRPRMLCTITTGVRGPFLLLASGAARPRRRRAAVPSLVLPCHRDLFFKIKTYHGIVAGASRPLGVKTADDPSLLFFSTS